MKKILILIFCITTVTSCQDFLEEETKSVAAADDFYSTVSGLEYLVTSGYVSNKIWYGKEEGFDFSDVGTDVYTYGQQHPNRNQFTYAPEFNPFNGRITVLWVEFYKGVNACNEALYYLNDESHPMTPDLRAKRKGEILFLRSHYFWLLTELWGNVPMPLSHTTEPTTTATKTDVKVIYNQIYADLNTAFDLIGETDNSAPSDFGRVTKDAVRALRARVALTMASYIKHAGNPFGIEGSAETYYAQALTDATTIINSSKYKFYNTYADLWKLENNSTSKNSEGIWAINYSRGIYSMLNLNLAEYQDYFAPGQKPFDEREGGHHGHMMWGTQYDFGNGSGMVRDLEYGRPFRRYAPNSYLINAYNESVDARFYGQFRTTWRANSTSASAYPKWSDFQLPAGFTPPGGNTSAPIFAKGDTALVITKKDINDSRIVPHKTNTSRFLYLDGKYLIWDYDILFNEDGSINLTTTGDHNFFIQLMKFDDPNRLAANGTGSQNGARDAYVFRIAEMYLIAAEAAMELGQSPYQYLLTLANSRTAAGATGTQLLEAYGITGDADITIDKILDERAREFPGEQLRWFDLKRLHSSQAFVQRINDLNFDTRADMKEHHYLRPIPQIQIDAIENKNEFTQNQGYN